MGKNKALVSSPHFHVFSCASCVDLTQLLSQPNASWRTLQHFNTSFILVSSDLVTPVSASRPVPSTPELSTKKANSHYNTYLLFHAYCILQMSGFVPLNAGYTVSVRRTMLNVLVLLTLA